MEIADALTQTVREANLTDTQVAASIGVTAQAVLNWRTGKVKPGGKAMLALIKTYPRFASLLGLAVV